MSGLEQRVIFAATRYAVSNGYAEGDRTAVGLVLAGMAIMAGCTPAVQEAMRRDYLAQHPRAVDAMQGWADFLADVPDPRP